MTSVEEQRSRTFRSLRSRNFRLWMISQVIAQSFHWLHFIALGLLVLDLTGSGSLLGLISALQFAPILVVGPWAGVIADRVDKIHLVLGSQVVMGGAVTVLGVMTLLDRTTPTVALICAGVCGTAWAFDQPTRRTIVSEMVPDDTLANAVSLNAAVSNASRLVGPAIGAAAIGRVPLGWWFLAYGVAAAAAVGLVLRLDRSALRPTPPVDPGRRQIREGLALTLADPTLRRYLILLFSIATFAFNYHVLLPLLVLRDLGAATTAYPILLATMAVGSLTGSLWLARRAAVSDRIMVLGSLLLGTGLALLAIAPSVAVAAVGSAFAGWSATVVFNVGLVAAQMRSAPQMRGRVTALFSMVFVGVGVGGLLSGWLADLTNARVGLAIGAGVTLASAAWLQRSATAERRASPTGPPMAPGLPVV